MAAGPTTAGVVVALVPVELLGPASGSTAASGLERRDGVEHRLQHPAVVPVRRPQLDGERDAGPVDHKVLLRLRRIRARFALICGVPADRRARPCARRLRESRAARLQSIRSAPARRSSMNRWSFFHTPRRCHSRSRRQHDTPEPPPISGGSIRQRMPLRSPHKIPVNTARSSTRERPPFRWGRFGMSGAKTAQSSSGTRGFMPRSYSPPHLVVKRSASSAHESVAIPAAADDGSLQEQKPHVQSLIPRPSGTPSGAAGLLRLYRCADVDISGQRGLHPRRRR
jgi:hypothetical protein